MKLVELQEKRERLIAEARERLDQITPATEASRVAELEAAHDAAMAELDALDKTIAREMRVAELESQAEEARRNRRPTPPNGQAPAQTDGGENGVDYRTAFYTWLAVGGDLAALEPEVRSVLRAGKAAWKADGGEKRAQSTSNTAGGYTVPTELANEIVRTMLAWGPMYDPGVTREIVTGAGNPFKIPTVNDTTVPAVAHSEGTALTDDGGSDVTFGQKSLDAYGFDTEFVRWSWELDTDSIFAMESLLADLLGERLGRIANSQLTTGTGSSAPNGIVTASTLGKTAAAVAAITFDELIDLEHSVDPAYRGSPRVRFMFHDNTLKALKKLKDGNGAYIWKGGDVKGGTPATLNGYAYSVNQAMAQLATGNKTVLFGDFNKYIVRKVGSPIIGVLRERFWPDNGIAGLIRFDGELADTTAVKHLIQA